MTGLRKAVVALAWHTGWSLSEISDLTIDELTEWLDALPKAKSDNG